MGRSLDELGHTLGWADIIAFLAHAPATSHVWQAEHPEQARQLQWLEELSSPQSTLLGEIAGQLEAWRYASVGAMPPEKSIIARLASRVIETTPKTEPAQQPAKPKAPKAQQRTASEIRALVTKKHLTTKEA